MNGGDVDEKIGDCGEKIGGCCDLENGGDQGRGSLDFLDRLMKSFSC